MPVLYFTDLGRQHPAGERQHGVLPYRHVHIGIVRCAQRLGVPDHRNAAHAAPPARSRSRTSSAAVSMPNVSLARSSRAARVSSPRSTLPASRVTVSDSARSLAACWVRRAEAPRH